MKLAVTVITILVSDQGPPLDLLLVSLPGVPEAADPGHHPVANGANLHGSSFQDYWQAGKSVDGVHAIQPVAQVVHEYQAALAE